MVDHGPACQNASEMRGFPPQLLAVLCLGIGCQVGQLVLLRELLAVFYGSELSIGFILASWLLWIGVGSWFGARLADRAGRPQVLLVMSAIGVLLALPATVLVARILRGFFDLLPGEHLSFHHTALACLLSMGPVCTLLGAQFVLLSRIWRENAKARDTSGATKTYVFESAGSVVGGVLFTLLLVHCLTPFQCALLVGMLMLAGIVRLESVRRGPLGRVVLLGLVLSAAVFPFLGQLDAWAYEIQCGLFAPGQQLVETRQSKHGRISVVRRGEQYSLYQNGQLAFSMAGSGEDAFELEEQASAIAAHLTMVQHLDPKRVLLIGGGLRGLLREVARHPVDAIDYVEPDRVLLDLAEKYAPAATIEALRSPLARLVLDDGRLFVRRSAQLHKRREEAGGKYDLIMVDVPDPATAVLNRFYTVEFFREARDLLAQGGVLAIGATSTGGIRGSALVNRNATIYHTLRSVFSHVLPVGESRCLFFATDSPGLLSGDASVLQERFTKRNVETQAFSELHYHSLLQQAPLKRMNWILRHHGRSSDSHLGPPETGPLFPGTIAEQAQEEKLLPPVVRRYFINSDFRPIGYFHTLVLWQARSDMERGQAFRSILKTQPWWILLAVGLSLLGALAPRGMARRYAVLFAIFTTGLSLMTLQVALILSFQAVYGFVYEMIGLITALFMAGMTAGAFLSHRLIEDKANTTLLALVQLAVALFACAIAFGLPASAGLGSSLLVLAAFSTTTFVAGAISGADFPLAAACYARLGASAERTAGHIYGLEVVGGCLGAILAGAIMVPVLGITACCLFAGIMNATAFVVILLSRSLR